MAKKEQLTEDTKLPKGVTTRSENQIRARRDEFQQVYANNVMIGFSSFDMGLTFGQIVGEQEGKTVIEELVRVLMPRELGKILAGLLIGNIEAYEQQFGEIKIPIPLQEGETPSDESGEPVEQTMANAVKKAKRR